MQRKKILFIVPRFGSVNRGVESFSFELISRMDTSLFDITVLSAPHEIELQNVEFIKTGIPLRESFKWIDRSHLIRKIARQIDLGSGADLESLFLSLKSIRLLRKRNFDVVLPLGGSWTYRLAKYVFSSATIISIGQAGPVKKDLKMSDLFVALTPFDEQKAKELLPSTKTVLIPNGIDIEKFKRISNVRKDSSKIILCVAALSPDKRHDLLFNAVMLLPAYIKVLCIGSGPHLETLEQHPLVKGGRVEFRSVAYNDMPDIYHQADIFSLASPEEAFGIVFLEAIASGLPVVAHNGPRQKYVIGENGALANCHDAMEYSRCLMSQINKFNDTKQNPIDFDKFNWNSIKNRYEMLFQKNL